MTVKDRITYVSLIALGKDKKVRIVFVLAYFYKEGGLTWKAES